MDISITSNSFFEKYKTVLTQEQFDKFEDYTLGVTKTLQYSDEEVADLNLKLNILNDFNEKLYRTAARNNKGIALEKDGNIESAMKIYEENIKDGYPAIHSFQRLMIIYRKLKRYSDEVRVIEVGMSILSKKNPELSLEWSERLIKVNKLRLA
jgi:tetratricopeptide (TPR) repeat protein